MFAFYRNETRKESVELIELMRRTFVTFICTRASFSNNVDALRAITKRKGLHITPVTAGNKIDGVISIGIKIPLKAHAIVQISEQTFNVHVDISMISMMRWSEFTF